uniref:type II secretion system protein GspL n=1 Tax=Puniceibacterium confluentis TaxID=1958944 RepID=UPI0035693DEE
MSLISRDKTNHELALAGPKVMSVPLGADLTDRSDGHLPPGAGNLFEQRIIEALGPKSTSVAVLSAESVSLFSVPLPVSGNRQRRMALPFAIEDQLATPLEDTHVALCFAQSAQTVLAAAVAKARMQEAVAAHPGQRLVPEIFAVPTPVDPTSWATLRDGDRVMVRQSDGTGFCAQADMIAHLWISAGRPTVFNYGQPLPEAMMWSDRSEQPRPPDRADLAIDMRQGAFRPQQNVAAQFVALVAGVSLIALAHLGLAYGDLRALRALTQDTRATTLSLMAQHLPEA